MSAANAQAICSCGRQLGLQVVSKLPDSSACGTNIETNSCSSCRTCDAKLLAGRRMRSACKNQDSITSSNVLGRVWSSRRLGKQVVKLLLSRKIAYAFQAKFDQVARAGGKLDMRLSREDEFFPGTCDRICVLSGQPDEIESHLRWILLLRFVENGFACGKAQGFHMTLAVPNSSVSAFIGKGGATVKLLQQISKCKIIVSQRMAEVQERLVFLSGPEEAGVLSATMWIVSAIQGNRHLMQHMHPKMEIRAPRVVNPELGLIRPTHAATLTKRELVHYLTQAAPREVLVEYGIVGPPDRIIRTSNLATLWRAVSIVWKMRHRDPACCFSAIGGGSEEENMDAPIPLLRLIREQNADCVLAGSGSETSLRGEPEASAARRGGVGTSATAEEEEEEEAGEIAEGTGVASPCGANEVSLGHQDSHAEETTAFIAASRGSQSMCERGVGRAVGEGSGGDGRGRRVAQGGGGGDSRCFASSLLTLLPGPLGELAQDLGRCLSCF
eukprot:TRINITY_DN9940_c0_g1_i1.p1 TRINITY_DN9940_c0_g1~~TRINITY_DN9940_c0_g1_i1.p1  ORF type:complete len:522 (+),score=59.69 TRINITY_DN9940_c0_g1_i1:71-1567(+)